MKIEDMDIYDLPIWACAVVDEIDETCRKRLKASPEYSRILKESDELLFKYPFISKIIDRDEINYERVQLYLMGYRHTLEALQLLEIL